MLSIAPYHLKKNIAYVLLVPLEDTHIQTEQNAERGKHQTSPAAITESVSLSDRQTADYRELVDDSSMCVNDLDLLRQSASLRKSNKSKALRT
eukprot:1513772-Amphidinium_carterae.1